MSNALRVGVVGHGNIATIAQLPTLVTRDDVEMAALVSILPDPEPVKRRWGFQNAYPTLEAALDAQELDAVFILTPRSEHLAMTKTALEAGVDVFCEKPLATTAAGAQMLAETAEKNGRILQVGFNRRFAPVYAAAHDSFGETGASFCVAQKNRAGSEYRATFENAIHMVDLVRWFCGGVPVEVTAYAAGEDKWQEDGISALIHFDNGHTGVVVGARNAGGWNERLDAYGQMTSASVVAPDSVTITRPEGTSLREMTPENFGWATATETMGFAGAVHHFLDRVRDRGVPLVSGAEAVKTQQLLERILEVSGLPTDEQPGRVWSSHAKK